MSWPFYCVRHFPFWFIRHPSTRSITSRWRICNFFKSNLIKSLKLRWPTKLCADYMTSESRNFDRNQRSHIKPPSFHFKRSYQGQSTWNGSGISKEKSKILYLRRSVYEFHDHCLLNQAIPLNSLGNCLQRHCSGSGGSFRGGKGRYCFQEYSLAHVWKLFISSGHD